ncbi:unnamed protein product [Soboliphyme baturini]|uniref:GRIP domain-containing protein n=1 Tax=Soboliphyme baturini TaxID=241478 RepID=A0A183IR53_9BILA|nr:unnamed protein product [Soboliphyme baturini]
MLNVRLSGMLNQIETLQSRIVSLNSASRVQDARDKNTAAKKRVKKVTFDLTDQELKQELTETYEKLKQAELASSDLHEENEELRLIIAGLERNIQNDLKAVFVEESLQQATKDLKQSESKVQQLVHAMNELKKERKCAVLRAKAQQTARIKHLEAIICGLEGEQDKQLLEIQALKTENESLKSSLLDSVRLSDVSTIIHRCISNSISDLWRIVDGKISAIDAKFTELVSRISEQNSKIHMINSKKVFDVSGSSDDPSELANPKAACFNAPKISESFVLDLSEELPVVEHDNEDTTAEVSESGYSGSADIPKFIDTTDATTSLTAPSIRQKVANLKILNERLDKIVESIMGRVRLNQLPLTLLPSSNKVSLPELSAAAQAFGGDSDRLRKVGDENLLIAFSQHGAQQHDNGCRRPRLR